MSKSEKRRIDSIVRRAERVITESAELAVDWAADACRTQIVTLPLSYRNTSNCIMVMVADIVGRFHWEGALHYHCYYV